MKIRVDAMPNEPKDCLFSALDIRCGLHVCTLRAYVPEADTGKGGYYKPMCVCKDCSKCDKLEVSYE